MCCLQLFNVTHISAPDFLAQSALWSSGRMPLFLTPPSGQLSWPTALLSSSWFGWGAASAAAILHSIGLHLLTVWLWVTGRDCTSLCRVRMEDSWGGVSVGMPLTHTPPAIRPAQPAGCVRMRGPHCACSQAPRQQGHLVPKQMVPSVGLLALCLCVCVKGEWVFDYKNASSGKGQRP